MLLDEPGKLTSDFFTLHEDDLKHISLPCINSTPGKPDSGMPVSGTPLVGASAIYHHLPGSAA